MGELPAPLGRYRREAALAVTGTVGEVVMEVFLPFIMACIIDRGVEAGDMGAVLAYGAAMLAMAALSLGFGMLAGYFSAKASVGYACALREGIFDAVQTYSFSNIDRFSTAGLVTRMTTDVTNMQNAAQMLMRIAVRSPIMLVSGLVACVAISLDLAPVFAVAAVFLAAALCPIMLFATRAFDRVFDTYDDLNASVQENVGAIRVVKAFVHEAYENERFRRAADKLYRLYVRAEGFVALNNPVVMLAVYGFILALSWFGAQLVVGGRLTTGELASLFSYVMPVLMSLMMLSMTVVMISMSLASARRIREALEERPDISNPERPLLEVADGSIDFDGVGFSYARGDIMSVYTNDVDTLRQLYGQTLPQFVNSGVTLVCALVPMCLLSVPLTLLSCATVAVMLAVTKRFSSLSGSYFADQQRDLGDVDGFIEEMMDGQKVVKVFCHEDAARADFRAVNDRLRESATRANLVSNLIMPVNANLGNLSYVIVAAAGAAMAIGGVGGLTIGALASFISLNRNLTQPITQVSQQMSFATRAAAGAARVFALMDEEPEEDHGYVELVYARELPDGTAEPCEERTEEVVQRGMDALMAGRTTFVIAHRLSTVRDADCICVMEDGRIVERGDHEELMRLRGRYWQLCTDGSADGLPAA